MKQIQNQEYHKKTASKAESKRRFSRQEQMNLTDEARRRIWGDRRRTKNIIQRRRKQKRSPYLSDRKLISFLAPFCIPLESKQDPNNVYNYINIKASENLEHAKSNARMFEAVPMGELHALRRTFSAKYAKGYIEAPPKPHKGEGGSEMSAFKLAQSDWPEPTQYSRGGDQAFDNVMSEAEFVEFVDMFGKRDAIALLESGIVTIKKEVLRRFMKHDDESQPRYTQPAPARTNVSAYTPWQPEIRKTETPEQAFTNMTKNNFMNSPEWDRFVALVGKEEAIKWFEAGLFQATRE